MPEGQICQSKKKSTKKDISVQARSAGCVCWEYWEWALSAAKNYLMQNEVFLHRGPSIFQIFPSI